MKLYKYLLRFKEAEYKYEVFANHQFWAEQFINNDVRLFDMQNQLSKKQYDNYSVLEVRKLFELDIELTDDKNILKTYESFMNLEDEKTVIMRKRELLEDSKLFGFSYEEWQTILLPMMTRDSNQKDYKEIIICNNIGASIKEFMKHHIHNRVESRIEKENCISTIETIMNGKKMTYLFISKNYYSQSLRGLRVDKISLSKY